METTKCVECYPHRAWNVIRTERRMLSTQSVECYPHRAWNVIRTLHQAPQTLYKTVLHKLKKKTT